jgi:hypothetical protein
MGHMDRPHAVDIDARPDDMAMLAPVLDMKDNGARLVGETKPVLDGLDRLVILLARQRRRRVDGQAVKRLRCPRSRRHRLEFREGAVKIARDRAVDFGDLDALVVERIH